MTRPTTFNGKLVTFSCSGMRTAGPIGRSVGRSVRRWTQTTIRRAEEKKRAVVLSGACVVVVVVDDFFTKGAGRMRCEDLVSERMRWAGFVISLNGSWVELARLSARLANIYGNWMVSSLPGVNEPRTNPNTKTCESH
jgi:hypothetical protein